MRFLILLSILCFSKISIAQQLTVLTESLPRYQYRTDNGEITGYGVSLVKEVLKRAGLPDEIKMLPWERAYRTTLVKKNVMLFSMVRTRERENLFKWIGEVDQLHYSFFGLKSRNNLIIKSIEEAKHHRIGVHKESFAHKKLKQTGFLNISSNGSYRQLLAMLNGDRFDLIFAPKVPLQAMLANPKYKSAELHEVFPFKKINQKLFIAVSKSTDEVLVEKLKRAYEDVVNSGDKARLMKAWLNKS